MNIRFASIPKTATRSLAKLNLLGEVSGVCGRQHSKLTEYPGWTGYEWMVVERDSKSWHESYLFDASHNVDAFTYFMNLRFRSFDEDMESLLKAPTHAKLPKLHGVNAWIPENFAEEYAAFLEQGMDFKDYCYATITCGIPCAPVRIEDLDDWLLSQGIAPVHLNVRKK